VDESTPQDPAECRLVVLRPNLGAASFIDQQVKYGL